MSTTVNNSSYQNATLDNTWHTNQYMSQESYKNLTADQKNKIATANDYAATIGSDKNGQQVYAKAIANDGLTSLPAQKSADDVVGAEVKNLTAMHDKGDDAGMPESLLDAFDQYVQKGGKEDWQGFMDQINSAAG